MRYFKQVGEGLEEYYGPQIGDAEEYRKIGYSIPYGGIESIDWLYVADGAIVVYTTAEYEALHPLPPNRYSRLKIINKLGGDWVAIENSMSALEKAKFYGATYLERGNEDFEAFIEKLKPTMPNIEELLIGCEYD